MKNTILYKHIISHTNIYNAIYSLESYVFEKGLLGELDIKLYHKLSDKYNTDEIEATIEKCETELKSILDSPEKLFTIKPYFRMKDYKEDIIRFRPIHTTDLISQICLICLLNPIMYRDIEEKEENVTQRSLSDISQLIPSNFYGNVPSVNVEDIFVNWKIKYKEYSEKVITKYNEYKESNEFSHEICLDLQDFFPSIDPGFIYNYILNKLSTTYKEMELECLKRVLSKLLYFNIAIDDVKAWDNIYYPNINLEDDNERICRGIPQGLPQSYYFGNLCMIEVSKIVSSVIGDGDAYYYVDDSVIYTNVTQSEFDNIIDTINKKCAELNVNLSDKATLSPQYIKIQNKIEYKIKFHLDGKSTCTPIKGAYENFVSLQNLARQVSNAAIFNDTLDDIEDNLVKEKLDILIDAINKEIQKYKKEITKEGVGEKAIQYSLKLLKRYKRFFLYRVRLLDIREKGEVNEQHLKDYYNRFHIKNITELNFKDLFETLDEEIFMAESRLLLQNMKKEAADNLYKKINNLESKITEKALGIKDGFENSLFYKKDLKNTLIIDDISSQTYKTLDIISRSLLEAHSFTNNESRIIKSHSILENKLFSTYTKNFYQFVYNTSNEFKRKIYNSLFSKLYAVTVSDHHAIYKLNNRPLYYYELRILIYLRNRKFKIDDFKVFAKSVLNQSKEDKGLSRIDTLIFEVIDIFIKRVKSPQFIDNLILTHRLVNGLWKNGSKFLNSYTLHNEEHAVDLIKNSVRIVRAIDYLSLKELDYYTLFLACYLHDISMVIHPNMSRFATSTIESDLIASNFLDKLKEYLSEDEKEIVIDPKLKNIVLCTFKDVFNYFETYVRDNHTKHSAEFIKLKHDSYLKFIEVGLHQIVATVAESHGYDASEVYGRKSSAKTDLHSIKYMMIILRLADILDMTKDRISYYILKENINQMGIVSQFHWISHLVTDQCDIKSKYKLKNKTNNYLANNSIQEKIIIDIHLNIKNLATIKNSKVCKGHKATLLENSIELTILDDKTKECPLKGNCPFICKWVNKKHYYLFAELFELKKYLKQVNNSLFQSDIQVNIQFGKTITLDPEFLGIINDYIDY